MTSLFERPLVMAAAALYLMAVLAIGAFAATRTRTAGDFFVAGRRAGLFVVGMATMASAFSGFVFIGGPGLTYRVGISSLFVVLPIGFTSAMLCWTLAPRLRLLAESREVLTIPDALRLRFPGRATAGVAAIALALGTTAYLAAQLLAFAVLARTFAAGTVFGGATASIVVGACALVAYSVAGGMLAGLYTDVLQGSLMIVAAVWIFVAAWSSTGGPAHAVQAIADHPSWGSGFLEPFGTMPPATAFGLFFVFGVGVLGQPHMLHKFLMLKDPRALRAMPAVIAGSQALVLLLWIGVGLAVPALVAMGRIEPLESPDDATAAFLLHAGPDALAGMVLAAALAAIMSSADSFLNLASAALVRDLPRACGTALRDELRWGRIATVGVAIAAALFALAYGEIVALLGTFAFGLLAATFVPVLALGLTWDRVTTRAAILSMVTGVISSIALEAWARAGDSIGIAALGGVLPAAVAIALALAVLVVASLLDESPRPALPADVRAALDFDEGTPH